MKKSSDWVIASAVVVSSIFLFVVLFMALRGSMVGRSSRVLVVDFPDVMGVNPGAQVKWAGARVGTVSGIRLLTDEERIASGNPRNMVRVTLALQDRVPSVPADITASVAADTLLSDKVILLGGGSPGGLALAPDRVVQGISPVTIDALVRDLSGTLAGLRSLLGGAGDQSDDLIRRLHTLLGDAQGVVDEAKPLLQDAGGLASEARELIATTKEPLTRTITRLDQTVGSLDQLTRRADGLIRRNEEPLTAALASLNVTAKNLKVTSTYTKILTRNLTLRPTILLWGGKPPALPSENEILRARGPVGNPATDSVLE